MHTVVQDAYKLEEGDNAFDWLQKDPRKLAIFQRFMSIRRQGAQETWLSVYPVEEETKAWSQEKAVYVNIGGNVGMQNAEFKQKYPNVPGRVILQDRPENVAKALQTPGVENITYDFFTPQPIKGMYLLPIFSVVQLSDTVIQEQSITTSAPFCTIGPMTRSWRS